MNTDGAEGRGGAGPGGGKQGACRKATVKRLMLLTALLALTLAGADQVRAASLITVQEPTAGVTWGEAQEVVIRWRQSNVTGPVRINLKKDGRKVGEISPAAGRVYADGTHEFPWRVPGAYEGSGFTVTVRTVVQPPTARGESLPFSIRKLMVRNNIPRGALTAVLMNQKPAAELAITRLDASGNPEQVKIGESVTVAVHVKNNSDHAAKVSAAATGGPETGFVAGEAFPVDIGPRGTGVVRLTIPVTAAKARGRDRNFRTTVFLRDPTKTGGALDVIWKDGNQEDNDEIFIYPVTWPDVAVEIIGLNCIHWTDNHPPADLPHASVPTHGLEFRLRISNQGNTVFRDLTEIGVVDSRVFAASTSSTQAYLARLNPGESAVFLLSNQGFNQDPCQDGFLGELTASVLGLGGRNFPGEIRTDNNADTKNAAGLSKRFISAREPTLGSFGSSRWE